MYYKGVIFLGYCHQIIINLTVGHNDKDISLKNYGKGKKRFNAFNLKDFSKGQSLKKNHLPRRRTWPVVGVKGNCHSSPNFSSLCKPLTTPKQPKLWNVQSYRRSSRKTPCSPSLKVLKAADTAQAGLKPRAGGRAGGEGGGVSVNSCACEDSAGERSHKNQVLPPQPARVISRHHFWQWDRELATPCSPTPSQGHSTSGLQIYLKNITAINSC